ncbi:MAG TPA: hypothetical protein VGI75_09505 [Pirellulales bacterium]
MKTHICLTIAVALLSLIGVAVRAADPENGIYQELTTQGVPLAAGAKAKLPTFTMDYGLSGEKQDQIIKDLLATNENAPKLEKFMEKKVNTPYFRVDSDIPNSTSHELDLYFTAYGPLATVADGNFWKSRLGNNKNGDLHFLTPAEMKPHNLKIVDQPTMKERYAHADVELFQMVKVAGTARAMETIAKESVVIAFLMDSSFQKDATMPNEWRPITFDKSGKKVVGDPTPYDGVGAYSKISELKNTPGALFVEYHIIWDEPKGWFNGKPVMKSKLGMMIENDVRSFRNDLKLGVAANPPAAGNQPAGKQQAATH